MTTSPGIQDQQNQAEIPFALRNGRPWTEHVEPWPLSEQEKPWQIVPPIVTGGRIPAVQPVHAPPEDATFFTVSFMGLDHRHYRVSATVSPSNGEVVRHDHIRPGHPVLHPAWQGEVVPQVSAREGSLSREELVRPSPTWPRTSEVYAHERTPQGKTSARETKTEEQRLLLSIIQPGLVGLMDGSVSTLAPIFAVAFATHLPLTAFLVGMASALGAGISMAFSEALSDDGDLTGRGNPVLRGGVTGLMTFVSGAGHALPFLIPDLRLALVVAYVVVALELIAIAAIRHRFFGTRWWLSLVQVVGGGVLVFVMAVLLGNA